MDIAQINVWLTKTTYGTVILGAAGSALFALVYWCFNKFIKVWFIKCYQKTNHYFDNELIDIHESKDTQKIVSYFAYHVSVIVISTAGLVLFVPASSFIEKFDTLIFMMYYAFLAMSTYFGAISFAKIAAIYFENKLK
jgi:hypothetical protein